VDTSAQNVSPSRRMQLCIVASVSVPFCKRGLKALYALANSNRSAPPSISPLLAKNGTLNFTLL
jgi:hypothetical protein